MRSVAVVATPRAERYAKQLASHLGRHDNLTVDDDGRQVLAFTAGTCAVSSSGDAVHLEAEAADAEALAQVQDVVGRHLVRFGEKDGLTVEWS